MAHARDILDPKGLIRDSYRIDGIGAPECRSIFLDWAMSDASDDPRAAIQALLERHASDNPDHPMTQVLKDGLGPKVHATRRGGARARREN